MRDIINIPQIKIPSPVPQLPHGRWWWNNEEE